MTTELLIYTTFVDGMYTIQCTWVNNNYHVQFNMCGATVYNNNRTERRHCTDTRSRRDCHDQIEVSLFNTEIQLSIFPLLLIFSDLCDNWPMPIPGRLIPIHEASQLF